MGVLGATLAFGGVSALPLGFVGLATAGVYANNKFGTKKTLGGAAVGVGLTAMASLLWDDEEPWDWDVELRSALRDLGGDPLEALVMRGVVNAVTGVNVSGRVSLDDLLWREPRQGLEGRDLSTHYLKEAVGPVVGYALNGPVAAQLWSEDHEWRAVEKLMPKFGRDLMTAMRFGSESALNMRGDDVKGMDWTGWLYSDDLTAWNLIWKAAGFGAEKVGQQYQKNSDYKNYERQLLASRGKLLSRYFMSYRERDMAGMRDVRQDMIAWNKANKQAPQIDAKAIERSMKARVRATKASRGGVGTKANYRYLMEGMGI